MKKSEKRIIIALIASVLCLSMTGCSWVTNMHEERATMTRDGNLVVDGKEFILLPDVEFLSTRIFNDYNPIYLADDEVPLLLSGIFGEEGMLSDDGTIIRMDDDFNGEYIQKFFCRKDKYDAIMEAVKDGYHPEVYQCDYYDWDEAEDVTYTFNEYEVKEFQKALKGKAIALDYDDYYGCFSVYSSMKGLPFAKEEFEVSEFEDGYYLEKDGVCYAVPEGLIDTIEKLMTASTGEDYFEAEYEDIEKF